MTRDHARDIEIEKALLDAVAMTYVFDTVPGVAVARARWLKALRLTETEAAKLSAALADS